MYLIDYANGKDGLDKKLKRRLVGTVIHCCWLIAFSHDTPNAPHGEKTIRRQERIVEQEDEVAETADFDDFNFDEEKRDFSDTLDFSTQDEDGNEKL